MNMDEHDCMINLFLDFWENSKPISILVEPVFIPFPPIVNKRLPNLTAVFIFVVLCFILAILTT